MDIIDIAGRTRFFGAPKDWDVERDGPCGGLPIRDEAFAPGVNRMISEWKPNEIEMEHLKLGAPIQLGVVGTVHPVVSLGVGAAPPRKREEPAERMSKIQVLMMALEAWPAELPSLDIDAHSATGLKNTLEGARSLILALMGISAKPGGEQIAVALEARARALAAQEVGEAETAGDLSDMLKFARRWLPECFPAQDNGQIPLARALCDSLMDAAEAHLKRFATLEAQLDDAHHEALERGERED